MKAFWIVFALIVAASLLWIVVPTGFFSFESSAQRHPPGTALPVEPDGPSRHSKPDQVHQGVFLPLSSDLSQARDLVVAHGPAFDWPLDTPAAKRAQIVELDAALLATPPAIRQGDLVRITFFEDATILAQIDEVMEWGSDGRIVALRGSNVTGGRGDFYLSYSGDAARVLVKNYDGSQFEIVPQPGKRGFVALEVDLERTNFLECGHGGEADEIRPIDGSTLPQRPVSPGGNSQLPPGLAGEPAAVPLMSQESPGEPQNQVVILDVLGLYTATALAAWSNGDVEDMEATIAQAINIGNSVHANSDTFCALNLVHVGQTSLTQSGSSSVDLFRLLNGNDGHGDDAHILRETYQADFVCLFTYVEDVGGIASNSLQYTSEERAFSITRVQQAASSYTAVHEISHNMGNGHSKTQTSQPGPGSIYPFAAGWQWTDTASQGSLGFCTVMTYENFDNDETTGYGPKGWEYIRVPHFSNPDIDYTGDSTHATGHPSHGNAAANIRWGRFFFGAYRGGAVAPLSLCAFPYTDGFENGLNWSQDLGDENDWMGPASGPALLRSMGYSTGPSSRQDGNYYIYTSAARRSGFSYQTVYGSEAIITTAVDFRGYQNARISFGRHMYGSDMGTLFLEASTDGGSTWSTVWSETGDQGDAWKVVQQSLASYDNSAVWLRFRAVIGQGINSEMGLDQVTFDADPIPVATVAGINPTTGPEGTSVTITGTNFSLPGLTGVSFDGVSANFSIDNSTQISATVPVNATSGPVSLASGGQLVPGPVFTVLSYTAFIDSEYPGLPHQGPGEDADLDGIPNFVEYILGLVLDLPDADGAPTIKYDPLTSTFNFSFRRGLPHVLYEVITSSDPKDWSSPTVVWTSSPAPPDLAPVGSQQVVEISVAGDVVFVRLRATE